MRSRVKQEMAKLSARIEELGSLVDQGERSPAGQVEEIRLLARIVATRQALQLAATLLDAHPHEVTGPVMDRIKALAEQVAAWREEGTGWFEERWVTRSKVRIGKNPETGEPEVWDEPVSYGPYYYYRYRDARGRLHAIYYGRTDPRSEGSPVVSRGTTGEPGEAGEGAVQAPVPSPKAVYSGRGTKTHLTLDGELALCGLTLVDAATSLSFQADGCQRCRQVTLARGLTLPR